MSDSPVHRALVHRDDRAGDVTRLVAGEEDDGVGDVDRLDPRLAHPHDRGEDRPGVLDRRVLEIGPEQLERAGVLGDERGVHGAGAQHVDSDLLGGKLVGQCPTEGDDARLGGVVVGEVLHVLRARTRAGTDDRPAVAGRDHRGPLRRSGARPVHGTYGPICGRPPRSIPSPRPPAAAVRKAAGPPPPAGTPPPPPRTTSTASAPSEGHRCRAAGAFEVCVQHADGGGALADG